MDELLDKQASKLGDDEELTRRGAWTIEEDFTLINYIAQHGEGRWNTLATCSGLKRTGKSCRLRWLNYLRPDVSRGNITLQEQLLILQLHSQWGNKWSKIAQHLPGRTDNEIKNYWRTRVQKHAKQLNCDVESQQFKDLMRNLWIPRLVEKIQAADGGSAPQTSVASSSATTTYQQNHNNNNQNADISFDNNATTLEGLAEQNMFMSWGGDGVHTYTSVESKTNHPIEQGDNNNNDDDNNQEYCPYVDHQWLDGPSGYLEQGTLNSMEQWMDGGEASDSLLFLEQQFNTNVFYPTMFS